MLKRTHRRTAAVVGAGGLAVLFTAFTTSAPSVAVGAPSSQQSTQQAVVVVAAGDICGSACQQTADLVRGIGPAAVFTMGDNAYDSGTLQEFRDKYAPTWGAFKSITKPSPGNHEYGTSGAAGYFDYFNGVGVANGPAGERGKGYYSWDLGDWHFVALNSNISMSAGSAQETWLRNDLKNSTKPCTAAYWHHPLFTRGTHSNSTQVRPLWQALYDNKADLILVGHDHNYQRYAPQDPSGRADPNGIRQLLVGTGGKSMYGFSRDMPNVEASQTGTYGVMKLTLTATGYTGDFVPVAGRTYQDNFSGTCKPKGTGGGTTVWSDDFETSKGWVTNPAGSDTATTGAFERGDPESTTDNSQTKQLGTTASGVNCLVTGRLAGSSAGTHDVDAGATSALSPAVTLPADGTLAVSVKWSTGFGANATADDYLRVVVEGSGGGRVTVVDRRGTGAHIAGAWQTATADISSLAGQSVRIRVEAADPGTASLVEAQIDDVLITRA